MRSGAPVKSPSCAAAIRGAATRPESLGVQVERATITASAARDVERIATASDLGELERAARLRGRQACDRKKIHARLVEAAAPRQLLHEIADHRLGVAEQHPGVVLH